MSRYSTITGRTFDLTQLSSSERSLLARLENEFRKEPAWDEFSDFWQKVLKDTLSRIPRDSRTSHPLYRIAQDLEMRLGIAQGVVAEPDYRDYIADRIAEKYGSQYRFCEEVGIPQAFLSQVLSGKKNFSIDMLRRVAEALDLAIALVPKPNFAELPLGDPLHRA